MGSMTVHMCKWDTHNSTLKTHYLFILLQIYVLAFPSGIQQYQMTDSRSTINKIDLHTMQTRFLPGQSLLLHYLLLTPSLYPHIPFSPQNPVTANDRLLKYNKQDRFCKYQVPTMYANVISPRAISTTP